MSIVKVPQLPWDDPKDLELSLPDDWQVEICRMSGCNRPALKPDGIRAALDKPIDSPPIRELAKGKKDVVIIFDDITRVTRPAPIVPFILEELAEAGIPDRNIRFVCGLGMHGAMDRSDFIKKLGADIVARYRVYNHHPFDHCVFVGTTELLKTPVYVNKEVMGCDLKIAITGCVPHPHNDFGGGGKIVLPGVASFETVKWHHSKAAVQPRYGIATISNNPHREDIGQAADLAHIDFGIMAIVNQWGDTVAIHAGALRPAYNKAFKEAITHYRTPKVSGKDIVIANHYAKANEAIIGFDIAQRAVSTSGGDLVLITNAPEGQITHYLAGFFGTTKTWAKQAASRGVPPHIRHLVIYSEYPHLGSSWFGEDERIVYMDKWDDVIKLLQKSNGAGTKVAVFPDVTNQYFA